MPIESKAQQAFLAIHKPKLLHKWAAETPSFKNLPEHVAKHADGGVTDTAGARKERLRRVGELLAMKAKSPGLPPEITEEWQGGRSMADVGGRKFPVQRASGETIFEPHNGGRLGSELSEMMGQNRNRADDAWKARLAELLMPRHACGNVSEPEGAPRTRMARGGVRAPRAGVRAPHAGVRNPHGAPRTAGIGKFVLPRYAEGGVAGDQPEPSITERIKNWLFGLGTLRKAAGGSAQGPPESPQAASQREQQEKERRTAEDLDRQSRGLPPKVRITPGWSR